MKVHRYYVVSADLFTALIFSNTISESMYYIKKKWCGAFRHLSLTVGDLNKNGCVYLYTVLLIVFSPKNTFSRHACNISKSKGFEYPHCKNNDMCLQNLPNKCIS